MSAHTPHELHDQFPHDACILTQLKLSDAHFRGLAARYHALNRSIHRIEIDAERASDDYLTRLRKQRLFLLDEIAVIIEKAELEAVCDTPTPPAAGLFGRGNLAAA